MIFKIHVTSRFKQLKQNFIEITNEIKFKNKNFIINLIILI
jgi:hypothetical protein